MTKFKIPLKPALAGIGMLAATTAAYFVAPHEGYVYKSYQDSIGIWTICRGHTAGVKAGMTATQEQCDAFYVQDIAIATEAYFRLVQYPHPATTQAAAISFIFNAGTTNFAGSTMRRKLNAGDRQGACDQFLRWKYAGGRDCTIRKNNCYGIIIRRQKERELCLANDLGVNGTVDFNDISNSVQGT